MAVSSAVQPQQKSIMSKTKQIIVLETPSLQKKTERLTGAVQACHYCSGSGWFWGGDRVAPEKQDCPMCKGSGKLRPVVTVVWEDVE